MEKKVLTTCIMLLMNLTILFSLYPETEARKGGDNSVIPKAVAAFEAVLILSSNEIEAGGMIELSVKYRSENSELPTILWACDSGKISLTDVENEADFIAPETVGDVLISVEVILGDSRAKRESSVKVLPEGALKKTVAVLVEVDTSTLKNVWASLENPAESFTPPLRIKGTFSFDEDTLDAYAGGSWPNYLMYDDGSHGDRAAGDGIWSLMMNFERTDAMVYFAFDDSSRYRVEFESGVTWRMKIAWIDLDEFTEDRTNPAFVPNRDQTISWTAAMAESGAIYSPIKK